MSEFARKDAIGLTWCADGSCHGVRLRRAGDSLSAVGYWTCAGGDEELTVSLPRGLQALEPDDNTIVIVGGAESCYGLADVSVPDLNPDQLRHALQYELHKHAPVATDELAWGYRTTTAGSTGKQNQVRVTFMRETEWRRWVDNVSGLTHSIDLIVPPAATVDPLLNGRSVYIPSPGREQGFIYTPNGNGRVLRCGPPPEQTFGALPDPLDAPNLMLGGLEEMAPEEQQRYAPALLLAMYGLTRNVKGDAKTWFRVPVELQTQRHRQSRRVAVALILYIVALAAIIGGRTYMTHAHRLDRIESMQQQVERRITELEAQDSHEEFVQALASEIRGLDLTRPTLGRSLVELTELIDDQFWVSRFQWRDGRIELEVQSRNDDLSFVQSLAQSPILDDVEVVRKQVKQEGDLTVRVHTHVMSPGGRSRVEPTAGLPVPDEDDNPESVE